MRASQGTGMMDSTIGGSRLLREREALSKGYFSLFLFASVLIGDRACPQAGHKNICAH